MEIALNYEDNDEETCKSIEPDDWKKKCVIKEGKCTEEIRYCSDYKSGYNKYCEELTPIDSTKICVLVNDNCIEQYKKCEDYQGNNEEMCNSIKPYNDDLNSFDYNLKCVLKENKCQQVEKSGEEEYADKFGYREYYKCEDYKENVEKSICEAIIPYDYSLKCVYKDNQCVEEERFCTENDPIKTRYYKCEDFNNEDSSKICKLYNNKCIETL